MIFILAVVVHAGLAAVVNAVDIGLDTPFTAWVAGAAIAIVVDVLLMMLLLLLISKTVHSQSRVIAMVLMRILHTSPFWAVGLADMKNGGEQKGRAEGSGSGSGSCLCSITSLTLPI